MNPFSNGLSDGEVKSLDGFQSLNHQENLNYLKLVVAGINRLAAYMNDFRTYSDENCEVDWLRQLQTYGVVHMLFADLISLNHTTNPHNQFVMAFGVLDKLANLKKHVGLVPKSEATLFEGMFSLEQAKYLKLKVRNFASTFDPVLGEALAKIIGTCYWRLHRELGRQLAFDMRGENERLKRMRAFRNLHHGAFLRSEQFEQLFSSSRGVIPKSLATLPIVLVLGLISDPSGFLSFHGGQ